MSDPDLEELRQQSSPGQRADGNDQTDDLVDALADERVALEDGDTPLQVNIRRDSRLLPLANVLTRDEYGDEYEDLVAQAEAVVDSKPDVTEGTKSYLLALLARAGLQEVAPEYDEQMEEAVMEFSKRRL
jgi:hypothetical protein